MVNSGVIERDGYGLQYLIEGSGAPAIVIGSAIYYPKVFSKNLREHLRFTFADHRGFALPSKVAMDSIELEAVLDDIEHVRKKLELERVILIGHSGHGFMALEYAKKYPENVSHVVLIAHGPDFSLKSQEMAEEYWKESASSERKAALEKQLKLFELKKEDLNPSEMFIRQYVLNGARIWYDYHFDSSHLWEGVEINMAIFNYVWGKIFRDIDITKGLETLNTPVFLALGRYDFLIGKSAWNSVIKKFQNITMEIFEKSGHTPQYEEAEMFDHKLLKWLKKNGR